MSKSANRPSQALRAVRLFRLIPAAAFLLIGWKSATAQLTWPGCADLTAADFRKVTLVDKKIDTTLIEPVKMAIAADGRIFFAERHGRIKILKPGVPIPVVAFDPVVFWQKGLKDFKIEDGTLGVTLDPGFAKNNWVYVYYSPIAKSVNRLSRFTLKGDAFDLTSEKILLEVDVQRDYCCHTGGAMAFNAQGDLFLTSGDNTRSDDNYGAIDERPGYTYLDAQRSAGNTNDLRGKLLRIHPTDDGKYTIPAGNLFPPGTDKTRPEIYSMGHRNPYTMTVDKYTGWALIGEVGPDADSAKPDFGPAQHEEFNLVKKPGNFGWPFLIGPNLPYKKYDYVKNVTGPAFDPNNLVNTSVNNTGLVNLPSPAVPAILSREFGKSGKTIDNVEKWSVVQGTTAMTGPMYYYDGANPSKIKLPPHFNHKWIMSDFGPGYINLATLDDKAEKVIDVQRAPINAALDRPLAFEIGPDGALYVIEYAAPNFSSTGNTKISRIEYTGSCLPLTPVPPTVALASRPGSESDHGLLFALNGERTITLPRASQGFDLFDTRGRKVWEYRRVQGASEIVTVPRMLPREILRIRYL